MRLSQIMLAACVAVWSGILGCIVVSNYWYCYYWQPPCLIGLNAGSLTIQRSPSIRNNWMAAGWTHSRRKSVDFSWGLTRFGIESSKDFDVSIAAWQPLTASMIPVLVLWRRIRKDRRAPAGHCRQCRYCLRGNTSGVCPECGTKILDAPGLSEQVEDLGNRQTDRDQDQDQNGHVTTSLRTTAHAQRLRAALWD